ncbi:hypothetical protein H311_01241 [Anncaliia algerae PRA109]|nr:hypothetical protein H311_01241 [Anncaliia algerae PRA109]
MLNFKCRCQRGRSAANISDALCIVEFNNIITTTLATLMENKKEYALVPIICSQINKIKNLKDEQRYANLENFNLFPKQFATNIIS